MEAESSSLKNFINMDKNTAIVILGTLAAWILYDLLAISKGWITESSWLRDAAYKATIVPFFCGFILGHWFFNYEGASQSGWVFALPILIAVTLIDIICVLQKVGSVWWRWPGFYVLLGIPVGSFLWGQSGLSPWG